MSDLKPSYIKSSKFIRHRTDLRYFKRQKSQHVKIENRVHCTAAVGKSQDVISGPSTSST